AAVDVRVAAIAFSADPGAAERDAGFASLADARYRGRLCLASSAQPINRAVIAALIEDIGVRPAEIAVRGWMANLALPVFADEAELRAALAEERCEVGIVSVPGSAGASSTTLIPAPVVADVQAAGVARHAREPEAALRLIEWLATGRAASPKAVHDTLRPVGNLAWRIEDAVRLAQRAGYR
ncbi:MAG: hypothetical protein R3288_09595, partial [Woeseiaceae bacterium]|nr:hypothetical protein [Woeseiaceae bacterium]